MWFFVFLLLIYFCFFFFFQAEDGIRDLTVTGVQTCALPISLPRRRKRLRCHLVPESTHDANLAERGRVAASRGSRTGHATSGHQFPHRYVPGPLRRADVRRRRQPLLRGLVLARFQIQSDTRITERE